MIDRKGSPKADFVVSLSSKLLLSALNIQLEPETFEAVSFPYESDEKFSELKELYKGKWFLYRRSAEGEAKHIIAVPIVPDVELKGERVQLKVQDHLLLFAALIRYRLPILIPDLNLKLRKHGLYQVRTERDLVVYAFTRMKKEFPIPLRSFHKYLKIEYEVRLVSLRSDSSCLVLCVEFGKKHMIDGSIADLVKKKIDVSGLWAVDLKKRWDERLIGKIVRVDGTKVFFDDEARLDSDDTDGCTIEASQATFSEVFGQVLGSRKADYDAAEWEEQAKYMASPGYLELLKKVSARLSSLPPMQLGRDLRMQFSGITEIVNSAGHTTITQFDPIQFCFDSDRSKKDRIPSFGLARFGPFDHDYFDKKTPRILVVGPASVQGRVEAFIKRFRDGLGSEGQKRFVNGFRGLYRLTNPQFTTIGVDLVTKSGDSIGERYRKKIEEHLSKVPQSYDAAVVVLSDEHAFLEAGNPYLFSKAFLLGQGIPVQQVRLSKISKSPYDLQFIFEDLSLALYAKLGGTPWTVMPAKTIAHEVVIGIGSSEVGGRTKEKRRYVGITTVFKSDGNYLLSAATKRCQYDEYPEVLKETVEGVLEDLKREQNWRAGETVRLVFHSFKQLRNTDIAKITTAAMKKIGEGIIFESAFLTIEEETPFLVLNEMQAGKERAAEDVHGKMKKGIVGQHVPARGTSIEIGYRHRLLCLNGPELVKRHKEPLPYPLKITLHPESTFTDLTALTRQVFYFTGLSWRSVRPVSIPVTILYSDLIAQLLNKLSAIPEWSPAMLNTKLRRSRWFL